MSQEIVKIDDIVGGDTIQLKTDKTYTVNASSTDEEYPSAKAVHLAVDERVEKETGKGLSTNDYTTTEKNKLAGIAAGAQVNIIEAVKVNGFALTPTAKEVNVLAAPPLGTDDNYVTDAEKILIGAIDGKVDENTAITGATKTKITYDSKGLVTSGADATTADVADSTNKRYVTDAQLTVVGNTSGTNTGDNATNTQYSGLAASKLSLDQATPQTIINGQPIQNTLTASQIVATDASKKLQSLAVATYPSLAELAYVKGVTGAIQTQIDAKAPINNPTFTGVAKAPNFVEGFTTTATANGTTVLTISSTFLQYFTGILNQTITLATTSLIAGHQYLITNLSTGSLTVNASGGTNLIVIPANSSVMVTALVATPTTSAQWSYSYAGQASELIAGSLLLANIAEAALGINDTKAMTPSRSYIFNRLNYVMYANSYSDLDLGLFNIYAGGGIFGTSTDNTTFEADGTMKMNGAATAWDDLDFPLIIKTTGVNVPAIATISGNVQGYVWAVNDKLDIDSTELLHGFKQNAATGKFHIHIVTNGLEAVNKYVKFQFEYLAANMNGVMTGATVGNVDLLIPANTPDRTHLIFDIDSGVYTTLNIGSQIIGRLTRIAATGAAPAANPFVLKFQLHAEKDTIGSRTITTK